MMTWCKFLTPFTGDDQALVAATVNLLHAGLDSSRLRLALNELEEDPGDLLERWTSWSPKSASNTDGAPSVATRLLQRLLDT